MQHTFDVASSYVRCGFDIRSITLRHTFDLKYPLRLSVLWPKPCVTVARGGFCSIR